MGTNRKEEIILTTLELAAEKGLAYSLWMYYYKANER